MKCPNCGADNPDYVIFCGQCSAKIRDTDPKRIFSNSEPKGKHEPESQGAVDAVASASLMAIAINVRRIFIVFGLMVILTIGSSLVSLWISISDYDIEEALSILKFWLVLVVIILIVGLIYAVTQKRLSRASLPPRVLR